MQFFLKWTVYNVLCLAQSFRLQFILDELRSDVFFLIGTGVKARPNTTHHVQYCDGYRVAHFGWDRSPFVNKSAGVAIAIREDRFNNINVCRVIVPETCIAGRGGAIRIKQNDGEFFFLTAYSPPPSGKNGGAKKTAIAAADKVDRWVRALLDQVPERSFVLAGGDINKQLGKCKDGTNWAEGVREFGDVTAGKGTVQWQTWLEHGNYSCIDTFFDLPGTYFRKSGKGTKIDHIFARKGTEQKHNLWIPWKSARKLQVIPDSKQLQV